MTYENTFDVVIEGAGAERAARVLAAPEGLYVNQQQIPYSTLLGVALRGSILLVVGTQIAMALRGSRDGLAALAAELRTRADLDHLAMSDRAALEDERVVFATPVAMSGTVDMERFKGMALSVVTDLALHVFERGGRHGRVAWDRIHKIDVTQAKFGRLLRVESGATQLEFLYLTDPQIQTIRGLASRHSSSVLGVSAPAAATRQEAGRQGVAPDGPQEATVAEPRQGDDIVHHFTIPEFEASLGTIGSGSDRPLGARIDRIQMSSLLPVGFLEEHLRELRTVYEGALLKRKRDAGTAQEVFAAAEMLDGRALWEDVLEAVGVVADATVRAFERQARRIAANRRIPWRKARGKYMPVHKEAAGLKQRLTRGVAEMESALTALSRAGEQLKPASEAGRAELVAAYQNWQAALNELDQSYAVGWNGLSREVISVWQDAFLPKLTRLGGERRRLLPRPLKVALYFMLFLFLAFLAYLVATGQLGDVIQFE